MAITKPICDICGSKESNGWMCQGAYQTCSKCSKDIAAFESQPMKDSNLKMLLETFLRRGRGEDVTFKEIHTLKSSFKFMEFTDMWREATPSTSKENKNG